MVMGMTIVFIFLFLLTILINVMSFIIDRFFPETAFTPGEIESKPTREELAVITAAVHHFIRSKK